MTGIERIMTMFGQCYNLLNNKYIYIYMHIYHSNHSSIFKHEAISLPCDDVKTSSRLAKRLMASLSFRIVETFLILPFLVHFMDFSAFFDAGKTLPSVGPTPSLSDENESEVVDTGTGDMCCRGSSETSSCLGDGFLNPITSLGKSANRWSGSSANLEGTGIQR